MRLLGRLAELAACQDALSTPAGDGAAAAVICGPAGIGKTSLWRAVAESQPTSSGWMPTPGGCWRRPRSA